MKTATPTPAPTSTPTPVPTPTPTPSPVPTPDPASFFSYASNADGTLSITGYTGTESALLLPDRWQGQAVTGIADSAFAGCTQLVSVTIPDTVTVIGENPFAGCTQLTVIDLAGDSACLCLEDGVLYSVADRRAVFCPVIVTGTVTLREGTVQVDASAFAGCSRMMDIVLPESLERIGDRAFYGCSDLGPIFVPAGVQFIGADAFTDCFASVVVYRGTPAADFVFAAGWPCSFISIGD